MSAQADSPVAVSALSPWGTAVQRANQRRDKRAAVLKVAAQLFRQHGFAGTSLDQIAALLGISKPTLYYYVPCKASLVQACADVGGQHAFEAVQRALQSTDGPACGAALQAYARAVATDFGWCMVRADEYPQPAAARQSAREQRQAIEAVLQPVLGPGVLAAAVLRALEGVALSMPSSQWSGLINMLAMASAAATPTHSTSVSQPAALSIADDAVQQVKQAPDSAAETAPVDKVHRPVQAETRAKVAAASTVVRSAKVQRAKAAVVQGGMPLQVAIARTQISLF